MTNGNRTQDARKEDFCVLHRRFCISHFALSVGFAFLDSERVGQYTLSPGRDCSREALPLNLDSRLRGNDETGLFFQEVEVDGR